jgi:hypothetical protein
MATSALEAIPRSVKDWEGPTPFAPLCTILRRSANACVHNGGGLYDLGGDPIFICFDKENISLPVF